MWSDKQLAMPGLPLPQPIRGVDPDSFARNTLSERLPDIARRVLVGHGWPSKSIEKLAALIESMPHGELQLLKEHQAPDKQAWDQYLEPHLKHTWLQTPWFLAETYFFRRLIAAIGYLDSEQGQVTDPYLAWKEQGLGPVLDGVSAIYDCLDGFSVVRGEPDMHSMQALTFLIHTNMWGNQADLSLFPAGAGHQPTHPEADGLASNLLVDDAFAASQYLTQHEDRPLRVDIILDNGGLELAYDLSLADFLLQKEIARKVILHAKPYPTYVSDATKQDVGDMVHYLGTAANRTARELADRLNGEFRKGRLSMEDHFYWVSPLSGWEMPADLRRNLQDSHLLISKGDANYRRWLGDRHWPFTTPVENILNYIPAPLVFLRVFKSNCLAGLKPGQAELTDNMDQDWLYNGAWGLIQFTDRIDRP